MKLWPLLAGALLLLSSAAGAITFNIQLCNGSGSGACYLSGTGPTATLYPNRTAGRC